MNRKRAMTWNWTLAAVCLLAAPLAFGVGTGGTGRMAFVKGTLAASPGVVVNGTTFDTSQADIFLNGQRLRGDGALQPGMVAGIDGRVNPGTRHGVAKTVVVTRAAFGRVMQVGTGGTGLKAAGVRIVARADAVFVGFASLADLALDDTLDVYGYSDGISGTVNASRIERVSASDHVELHGIVSGLTASTFDLQGVPVDYSKARLDGFATPLADGDRIAVRGTADGNGIAASVVSAETDLPASNGERVEVEGAISAVPAAGHIIVDDLEIDATHASFAGGAVGDLAVGRVVHAEGTVANGVLQATKIEFDDDEVPPAGPGPGPGPTPPPEDVDGAITAMLSPSTFTLGGLTVDAATASFTNGTAGDLAAGRIVHVRGTRNGAVLNAVSIVFEPPAPVASEVEGVIASVTAPGWFVVRGVVVDARAAKVVGGSLAKLRAGMRVHASGRTQDGVLIAKRVVVEN
jgi:hypothetical protein